MTAHIPKKTEENKKGSEFAVIHTGGKQYQVSVGDSVKIEKLSGIYKQGDDLTFDRVLLVDDGSNTTIGMPYIKGLAVKGRLEEIGRYKKVTVIHYKQKSRYFKKAGHRQPFFKVRITGLR